MAFLLEILLALGIATESLAFRAALVNLFRLAGKYASRAATIRTRYAKMIKLALTVEAVSGVAIATRDAIKEWLSEVLGAVVDELDKESVKKAVGKALADYIRTVLETKYGRYGITFPIPNLYSPTIVEELSGWMCDVLNGKVSEKLGRRVVVLNSIVPYDNVFKDLDAFITNEINLILGTEFTSILTDIVKWQPGVGTTNPNQLRDYLNGQFLDGYRTLLQSKIDAIALEAESLAGATLAAQRNFIINRLGQEVYGVKFLRKSGQARNRIARIKNSNNIKQKSYRDRTSKFTLNMRLGENNVFINDMMAQYKIKNEALLAAKKAMMQQASARIRFLNREHWQAQWGEYSGPKQSEYNAILAELNLRTDAYNAAKF